MVIPCVLSIVAATFTYASAFQCSFFSVTKGLNEMKVGYGFQHTISATIKVGIWSVQEDWDYAKPDSDWTTDNTRYWMIGSSSDQPDASKSCVSWDASVLDELPGPAVKFARMFSFFAVFLATVLAVLIICYTAWDPFCGISEQVMSALPDRKNWPKVSLVAVLYHGCTVAGLLNTLFLIVLAAPVCTNENVDACRLSGAGYMCILSVMLWWMVAASIWFLGRSKDEPKQVVAFNKTKS